LARNDSFLVFQTGLESNSKLSFFSNFSTQLFTPLPHLLPLLPYTQRERDGREKEKRNGNAARGETTTREETHGIR
jgi:hypothetical protein